MLNAGRTSSLALSLFLLAGMPLTGCTQEASRMDPALASKAFPGDTGMAGLAGAVRSGDTDEVKRLAPAVDLNARGDQDVTLLQWAILSDSLAAFDALLDAGADPHGTGIDGESPVHTAAFARNPAFLDTLVKRGANVSIPAASGGHGPLLTALMAGNEDHAAMLLRAGADPDQADEMGDTPLHATGQMGTARLALMLLEAGANPGVRNARGATFDEYLFDRPDAAVTPEAERDRRRIRQLLASHPQRAEPTQ